MFKPLCYFCLFITKRYGKYILFQTIKNGEFVLQGNRYIFPLYLRTSNQYKKLKKKLLGKDLDSSEDATGANDPAQREDERKTDKIHVVLLHELLEPNLKQRLGRVLETLRKNSWDGALRLLRTSLCGWLKVGNNTLLHRFIFKYGIESHRMTSYTILL